MNKPLISVIMPVYNTAKYLEKTLNALKCQTYENIEFIIIDDGSTDNSAEICDKFADSDNRFKVIHQENKGVCAARNRAISEAKGEYIGFCDSDDLPDNDLYETLYNLIEENQCDVSMVKAAFHFCDGTVSAEQTGKLTVFNDNTEALKLLLTLKTDYGVYTKLISSELCRNVKFEEPRKINEDKYFLFEVFIKAKKICFKDICKYNYIRHPDSSSNSQFSEKYLDMVYFADKIEKTVNTCCPSLNDYATANKVMTYLRFFQLAISLDGEKMFPEEKKEMRNYLKSVDSKICKKLLTKKMYLKWKIFKMGKTPYKLSIKFFTHA